MRPIFEGVLGDCYEDIRILRIANYRAPGVRVPVPPWNMPMATTSAFCAWVSSGPSSGVVSCGPQLTVDFVDDKQIIVSGVHSCEEIRITQRASLDCPSLRAYGKRLCIGAGTND